jgi:hypothetical protein
MSSSRQMTALGELSVVGATRTLDPKDASDMTRGY